MENYEGWKKQKKASIKKKIARLATKIVYLTGEIKKFGPRLRRRGMSTYHETRNGMIRNWHKGALQSLMSTRKKIYALQAEERNL